MNKFTDVVTRIQKNEIDLSYAEKIEEIETNEYVYRIYETKNGDKGGFYHILYPKNEDSDINCIFEDFKTPINISNEHFETEFVSFYPNTKFYLEKDDSILFLIEREEKCEELKITYDLDEKARYVPEYHDETPFFVIGDTLIYGITNYGGGGCGVVYKGDYDDSLVINNTSELECDGWITSDTFNSIENEEFDGVFFI